MTRLPSIPDSRALVFSRCGHWVQIERVAEFHTLFAAFLGVVAG